MSRPRRSERFNPSNDVGRSSRESKVTSTPMQSPPRSISISLSSIGSRDHNEQQDSDHEHVDVDPSNHISSKFHDVSSSIISLSESEEETKSSLAQKKITVKWDGAFKALKPNNKDSLYYKLMNEPKEINVTVKDVLTTYHKDRKQAVLQIMQLWVDLSGMQIVNVDVYDFDEDLASPVLNGMENAVAEDETGKAYEAFIFMKSSGMSAFAEQMLQKFVQYLVFDMFGSSILYDEYLQKTVFQLIKSMSFCRIRPVRITGVFIALEFLTSLVKLLHRLMEFIKDNPEMVELNALNEKKQTIEDYIEFFFFIYNKNCLTTDKKCSMIKIKCLHSVAAWIVHFPEEFILKRRCIGHIAKLIQDEDNIVRRTGVEICKRLVSFDEIYPQMKQRIELCLKVIADRILDVDYTVATNAVNVFTAAIKLYVQYIIQVYKLSISVRIFQKNLALAKASAKFVMCFLESQNKGREWVVVSLVKIAFCEDHFHERTALFVEAILEASPELNDFRLLFELLLSKNVKSKKCFLQLINEIARYRLTGKLSVYRNPEETTVAPVRPESHAEVASALFPVFVDLLALFAKDRSATRHLTEILTFIDFSEMNISVEEAKLFICLQDVFQNSLDPTLLEMTVTVFENMSKEESSVKAELEDVIEVIKKSYCNDLIEQMESLTISSDNNTLLQVRETSIKISALFAKFDLTRLIRWDLIFVDFRASKNIKAFKYFLDSCKHHILWRLRRLITKTEVTEIDPLLFNNCKDFIYTCVELLIPDTDHVYHSVAITAFECLCDLYNKLNSLLRRNHHLNNLMVAIDLEPAQNLLVDFAVNAIQRDYLSLNVRQRYVCNLVDLIYLTVLPLACAASIMKFYDTHYEQFGDIMGRLMSELTLVNTAVSCVVMHTLAESYKELLEKYHGPHIQNEDATALKRLVIRFTMSDKLGTSRESLKLVLMNINFAFSHVRYITFLYFVRPFLTLLTDEWKTEAYQVLTAKIPDGGEGNETISYYASILKKTANTNTKD